MNDTFKYDVAVVGGGLAGLATAIQLGKNGKRVILFEKEQYPFHKVCGEYISLESYDFLETLGLPLKAWRLPIVKQLLISSPNGKNLHQQLPLGGIGISRYKIDFALVQMAREADVAICDNTKVQDIIFENKKHSIHTNKGIYHATVCCGAFGKRSNLDVKWKRQFVLDKNNPINNFVAVKYHAILDHPRDTIALHNFKNGYCGISPVEDNITCICYLTTAQNLRNSMNSVPMMEEHILYKNRFLQFAFKSAKMLYNKPLVISQISFDKKEQVQNHVLYLGDAAGMITPLCGNGMSMALHSSKIASILILRFLEDKLSRNRMELLYQQQWKNVFAARLKAGRLIQQFFGNEFITNRAISVLKHLPGLATSIIRKTHGANKI